MQSTSLQAYASIIDKLPNKRRTVFEAMLRYGKPCTHKQLAHFMELPINEVTPRVGELVKAKYVVEVGKREQDGMQAKVWTVKPEDGQLPIFF